jgi:arylsulfatase A-like enzyme
MRLSLALALALLGAAPAQDRKPNVLILLADDLGYADVGFHGCKDIPTPNLDALAQGGVRCTNGYVSGPYCSPTRAGLLTGRYQQRFGHEFNPAGLNAGLPVGEATLVERFKAAGYVTGLVGKWHLGSGAAFQPQKRGLDEFFGFLGGGHTYFAGSSKTILRSKEPAPEKEYLTDAFGREAVSFIERHAAKPFLLYLAFNAVHTPMEAPEDRLKRFDSIADKARRTYAGMLTAMDEAVGKVMAKLRAAGLEERTLVFFLSDNGGPTMPGTTINGAKNDPLRGSKRTTWEGGVRVPFVVSWKGRLPAGKTYDPPVIQLDILPTALAAAGLPPGPEDKLDGVNLLPFLEAKESGVPHDTLYWRFGKQMAIRRGDWKLVEAEKSPRALYNLAQDVAESKDLSAANPEKVKELESAWEAWNAQLAKPLW